MGLIQIDMPMPNNCLDCPACNEYLTCAIPVNGRKWGENDVREFGQGRPEWCPMKEQEAVEARKKNDGIPQPWTSWWYVCGDCGQEIEYHDRFCRWCGRRLKW